MPKPGPVRSLTLSRTPPTTRILDLRVHRLAEEALVEWLLWRADRGQGAVVSYLTADTLVRARREPRFRAVLERVDLRYADGMGVVAAARVLSRERVRKVTANAFFERLCSEALLRGRRLAFVGARPGVADRVAAGAVRRAAERSRASGPEERELRAQVLARTGHASAPEWERFDDRLKAFDPHLVFVGMGQPRQETWALAQRERLPRAVFHCVGGLFDTASGRLRPAPPWLRRAGLEWTLRLAQEPRRLWRRYLLGLPVAFGLVAAERLRAQRRRS